jgi:hypothetical protein
MVRWPSGGVNRTAGTRRIAVTVSPCIILGGPPVGSPLTSLIPLCIASNLEALSNDLIIVRRNRLEKDMTLFSSTILSRRVPMQDRQISSEIDFGVWASIVLIGLAVVSVALGVAPAVDPTIFPAP